MLREHSPYLEHDIARLSNEELLEHAHPMRLAEEIGSAALDALHTLDADIHKDGKNWLTAPENHHIARAWELIEKALTTDPQTHLKMQRKLFADAKLHLNSAAAETSYVDEYIQASMTSIALRSFRSRAYGNQPGSQIMYEAYGKMLTILGDVVYEPELCDEPFDPHDKNAGKARGALCEALTYTLLMRTGKPDLLPYPASTREDRSNRHYSGYNHDFYLLDADGYKLPIQVKRSRDERDQSERLRKGITTVVLQPLIVNEVVTLRDEMSRDREDTTWYGDYLKLGRPDTFLARCFIIPSDTNVHYEYAATTLIKRVSTSIVQSINSQAQAIEHEYMRSAA